MTDCSAADADAVLYMPLPQVPSSRSRARRTDQRRSAAPRAPVEAVVHALDRDLPVYPVRTMERVLERVDRARTHGDAGASMVFAIVALTLASVGLYGVVAHGGHGADARDRRPHRARRGTPPRARPGRAPGSADGGARTALGVGGAISGCRGGSKDCCSASPQPIRRRSSRSSSRCLLGVALRRLLRAGVASDPCRSDPGTAGGIETDVLGADAHRSGG